jgi:hypothetical protein
MQQLDEAQKRKQEYIDILEQFKSQYGQFEVEIASLEIEQHANDKKIEKLSYELKLLTHISFDTCERIQGVRRDKKRKLEEETCGICFEPHCLNQITTTSCNHTFGRACISQMLEHNRKYGYPNACPYCRTCPIYFTCYYLMF